MDSRQDGKGKYIEFTLKYRRDDKMWFFICPLCRAQSDTVDDKMSWKQKDFYYKPSSTMSLSMSSAFGKLKRHIRTSHKFIYTSNTR